MTDVVADDDTDAHVVADLGLFGIRSINSPRRTFGFRHTRAFSVGVVGRYVPRRNGDQSLICFACFLQ